MSGTRKVVSLLTVAGLLWCFGSAEALAQRGMGDPTGVARQAVRPALVSLSGKVTAVESGPCELTTGPAGIGTHVMLETEKGESLNVHLGPQLAVAWLAERLKPGTALAVTAFRTDKMPEGHYVAQSLTLGEETIDLRDTTLRPMWAGGRGAGRGGLQSTAGLGFGSGYSANRGPGRAGGAGQGRGPQGFGPGQAMGPAGRYCPRWGGPPQGGGQGWGPAPQGRGPAWGAPAQGPRGGPGQGLGQGRGQGRGAGRGAGFGQQQRQGRGPGYGRGPAW